MGIGHKVCPKVQGHKGKLWSYGIKVMASKTFGNIFLSLPFLHAHMTKLIKCPYIYRIGARENHLSYRFIMSISGLFF
jgi:hypothetical protein